ncbi:hypothetical protein GQ457_03G004780 [Hibiscus cannabinus]
MDSNFYDESNELNVLKSSNISKLATTPVRSRGNYYSSPGNLIKYLRSNSLSGSGNSGSSGKSCFRSTVSPQSEKTPPKVVDEDVFVMDGVLVASDTNIKGSGSSPSGSTGFYKSEICRTWEELGHCRYGSKCQFEHGKEDVRPTCLPFRTKSEVYKPFASSKPRLLLHPVTGTTPTKPETTRSNTNFTMKPKTNTINPTTTTTTTTNGANWSPQDDGIDVTLPPSFPGETPSRGDIDACIDGVLYGPTTKKRLPAFSAIRPE